MPKTGTPPRATVAERLDTGTRWLVQWPSTRKAYYATTSHDSEELTLETEWHRRPVSPRQERRVAATVRAAIERARSA